MTYILTQISSIEGFPTKCEHYVFHHLKEANKCRKDLIDWIYNAYQGNEIKTYDGVEFFVYDEEWDEQTWFYISEVQVLEV